MIFGENREALRDAYRDAWQKHQNGHVLTPLEAQIAAVVEEHPEYQLDVLSRNDSEPTNSFLHMGLHLALRDQVKMDRPAGIAAEFARLQRLHGDAHAAEHSMFDALSATLWEAQERRLPPDENAYLERLRRAR